MIDNGTVDLKKEISEFIKDEILLYGTDKVIVPSLSSMIFPPACARSTKRTFQNGTLEP